MGGNANTPDFSTAEAVIAGGGTLAQAAMAQAAMDSTARPKVTLGEIVYLLRDYLLVLDATSVRFDGPDNEAHYAKVRAAIAATERADPDITF